MYGVIGFIIGLLIHFLIVRPIAMRRLGKKLIDEELIPKDYAESEGM